MDRWLRRSQCHIVRLDASAVQASHSKFNAVASPADDESMGHMRMRHVSVSYRNTHTHTRVSIVGRAHVIATNCVFCKTEVYGKTARPRTFSPGNYYVEPGTMPRLPPFVMCSNRCSGDFGLSTYFNVSGVVGVGCRIDAQDSTVTSLAHTTRSPCARVSLEPV